MDGLFKVSQTYQKSAEVFLEFHGRPWHSPGNGVIRATVLEPSLSSSKVRLIKVGLFQNSTNMLIRVRQSTFLSEFHGRLYCQYFRVLLTHIVCLMHYESIELLLEDYVMIQLLRNKYVIVTSCSKSHQNDSRQPLISCIDTWRFRNYYVISNGNKREMVVQ